MYLSSSEHTHVILSNAYIFFVSIYKNVFAHAQQILIMTINTQFSCFNLDGMEKTNCSKSWEIYIHFFF